MKIWIGFTSKDPVIEPNPHTGEVEHLGYEWLDSDEIINNCLDYLRPYLIWAKKAIDYNHNILTFQNV